YACKSGESRPRERPALGRCSRRGRFAVVDHPEESLMSCPRVSCHSLCVLGAVAGSALFALVACSSDGDVNSSAGSGGAVAATGTGASSNVGRASGSGVGTAGAGPSSSASTSSGGCGGQTCPTGYTCGTANGLPVCVSADGIPLFSHVLVILM